MLNKQRYFLGFIKKAAFLFVTSFAVTLFTVAAYSKPRIAVVVKSMQNEFFIQMQKSAEEYQAKHKEDLELIFKGLPNETDLSGQIRIVKSLIQSKVDALIIAPVDSVKIIPTLMTALKEHVLVINLDNKLNERALADENVNIPFVGPSNFNGARDAGAALATDKLKAGDIVGIIEGLSTSVNAKARSDGFRDAMKTAHIEVSGTLSGNWEEKRGKEAALKLLKNKPQLKALLCGNDNMAIGAIQAIDQLKLTGKVYVVGYDNIPKAQPLLKSKALFATVDQYPGIQAVNAIELAINALKNKKEQAELPKIVHTKTLVIKATE